MKTLTIDDVVSLNACYSREKITSLFNGEEVISLGDVMFMDIPAHDKLWIIQIGKLISDEKIAATKELILNLIEDHDSPEYLKYQESGTLYGWGPVAVWTRNNNKSVDIPAFILRAVE